MSRKMTCESLPIHFILEVGAVHTVSAQCTCGLTLPVVAGCAGTIAHWHMCGMMCDLGTDTPDTTHSSPDPNNIITTKSTKQNN